MNKNLIAWIKNPPGSDPGVNGRAILFFKLDPWFLN